MGINVDCYHGRFPVLSTLFFTSFCKTSKQIISVIETLTVKCFDQWRFIGSAYPDINK